MQEFVKDLEKDILLCGRMSCMIDVCIDARMGLSSGIGTYIRELIPFLVHFRLILLVDRKDQDWARNFEQILFSAPIYSAMEQVLFPAVIPRCDLFWSPHYNVPLLPVRARKKVATIHDACHLAMGSFAQKLYARTVMTKALRGSDKVVTVSQFSKREVESYFRVRGLEVIPAGVNQLRYRRQAPSEALRSKLSLPERFALFVGNFKPHKNIDRLVRAFSKISIPNFELILVGRGTPLGQVTERELLELYSMAEMFIFPSLYEGFGSPPLEAMSCGCPTLVSNRASMPEVCGDASLYFNPEKEEEITDAIIRVATDPKLRHDLIHKGLERIKMFSWERSANQLQRIFEELCRGN